MKQIWTGLLYMGIIGLDQYTKYLARTYLETPIELTDWAQLVLVYNPGIAFSLPVPMSITITLGVLFGIGLCIWGQRSSNWLESLGAYCMSAGAIGNVIDRIWLGEVTDMVQFWNLPVWNLADASVTMGVIFIIFADLYNKKALE